MLNNMPPFFITMLTILGIDIFSKKEETNTPLGIAGIGNLYQNYRPNMLLTKVIKVFESGSFTAPTKSTAYYATAYEKSKGIATIGNGSTYVCSNDFKNLRRVKITDTLQSLKILTKNQHLNDEDFAYKLTYNHLMTNSIIVYKPIAKQLDNLGVIFDENLALHLWEFCYGSGSLNSIRQQTKNTFLNDLKLAKNSFERNRAVLRWRLNYYKLDVQWGNARGGWTTRMLTIAKYFSNLISFEKIISQKSIYETNYNQKRIDLRTVFNLSETI